MKDFKFWESCSLSSFVFLTELKIDAMHLAMQTGLQKCDKYAILENIDSMIEEVRKVGTIQAYSEPHIEAEEAEMKLEDLRRWFIMTYCYDQLENCNKVMELQHTIAEKEEKIKYQRDEMKAKQREWNKEKWDLMTRIETMNKKDEWAERVTYEAVVEQIAACEDAKERDEARKLIEPLLSKNMATTFRKDIRRRVKELNEGGGPNITIENVSGDFNVNKNVKQIGN